MIYGFEHSVMLIVILIIHSIIKVSIKVDSMELGEKLTVRFDPEMNKKVFIQKTYA